MDELTHKKLPKIHKGEKDSNRTERHKTNQAIKKALMDLDDEAFTEDLED